MIKSKEEEIKKRLLTDEQSQKAFEKMLNYYQVYDKIYSTKHSKLIEAIYLDNRHKFIWELSEIGSMGYSAFYEHRKKYVECFYICLE